VVALLLAVALARRVRAAAGGTDTVGRANPSAMVALGGAD
jgi:hypothetical protein